MNNIIDAIFNICKEKNIGQIELARRTGLSQPYISNLKNHKWQGIEIKTLSKLAKALDVKVILIYDSAGKEKSYILE